MQVLVSPSIVHFINRLESKVQVSKFVYVIAVESKFANLFHFTYWPNFNLTLKILQCLDTKWKNKLGWALEINIIMLTLIVVMVVGFLARYKKTHFLPISLNYYVRKRIPDTEDYVFVHYIMKIVVHQLVMDCFINRCRIVFRWNGIFWIYSERREILLHNLKIRTSYTFKFITPDKVGRLFSIYKILC